MTVADLDIEVVQKDIKNIHLAVVMDVEIQYVKKDNWIGNTLKERQVKMAIAKHIEDPNKVDQILEIVKNQKEYR